MTTTTTLDNGLRVIVHEQESPVSAVYLWFDGGTALEVSGEEGVAHFLEHMLFKGTERRGVGVAAAEIEGLGGDLNAYTTYDQTVFHATVETSCWRQALDVLVDMCTASTLDEGEVERERLVVLEEIRAEQDNPESVLAEAVQSAVFSHHPYARPVLGTVESVGALTREQLYAFWRAVFQPANVILCVAGKVNPEAVLDACSEIVWPAAPPDVRAKAGPSPACPPQIVHIGRLFETTAVEISWPCPPCNHEDLPALEILLFALSQGDGATLQRSLQRRQELASDIWGTVWSQRWGGAVSIGFLPREEKTGDAVAATLEEVSRILRRGLPGTAIDRARTSLLADLLFTTETMDGIAHDLCWHLSRHGSLEARAAHRLAIAACSGADVLRAARRWLQPADAVIGYVDKGITPQRIARLRAPLSNRIRQSPRTPTRTVFENGATLWVLPDQCPVSAVRVCGLGGARSEQVRTAGTRTAWTRMLSSGAGPLDADAWGEAVDRIAGVISGVHGNDTTGIRATFPAENLLEGLDLVGYALTSPRFEQAAWARVQEETLEELETRLDRADEVLSDVMRRRLYPGHPWRLPALGTEASVRRITPRRLHRWHQNIFSATNLVLTVAGGVDPEAVREHIGPWLSRLPARGSRDLAAPAPTPTRDGHVTYQAGHEQAWTVLATQGTSHLHPLRRPLELAAAILGGQGGRLFLELREQRGLAYSVWSDASAGLDMGQFSAGLATAPDRAEESREQLVRIIHALAQIPPSIDEVDRCRRMLVGHAAMRLQRTSGRAAMVSVGERLGLPWGLESYRQQLAAVTPDQVSEALRYTLNSGTTTITMLPL